MNAKELLGSEIRARRQELGLAQYQVAKKAKLQQSRVSDVELGKGNPTLETLDAIARVLGTMLSLRPRTGTVSSKARSNSRDEKVCVRCPLCNGTGKIKASIV